MDQRGLYELFELREQTYVNAKNVRLLDMRGKVVNRSSVEFQGMVEAYDSTAGAVNALLVIVSDSLKAGGDGGADVVADNLLLARKHKAEFDRFRRHVIAKTDLAGDENDPRIEIAVSLDPLYEGIVSEVVQFFRRQSELSQERRDALSDTMLARKLPAYYEIPVGVE
jgi:hypothetical protein